MVIRDYLRHIPRIFHFVVHNTIFYYNTDMASLAFGYLELAHNIQ